MIPDLIHTWRPRVLTARRLRLTIALAATVGLATAHAAAQGDCQWQFSGVERVVAVGDVHGAYDELVTILQESDLIDDELKWIGGGTHLVMLGDIADRGPRPRDCFDLVIRLQQEAGVAGGRLHFLLGNHEIMNLVGDLRYVADEDFASYEGTEDEAERKREIRRQMRYAKAHNLDPRRRRAQIRTAFPDGYFARHFALSPTGRYGRWLLDQQILIRINGVVYVHGGLPAGLVDLEPDAINPTIMGNLTRYLKAEAYLVESGALPPEMAWNKRLALARRLTIRSGSQKEIDAAQTMLDLSGEWPLGEEGPLWYRGTALHPEETEDGTVARVLDHLGATTVVIGHTPTHTGLISTRFGGAVIRTDTGMLTSHYGGRPSALELRDNLLFELYPGRRSSPLKAQQWELTATMFTDEADIESFLTTATVASIDELGSGSTRPMLVALADNGRRSRAMFKTIDTEGPTESGDPEPPVRESYTHEVAAYRIDRLLGLGMVPPTVIRTIDGVEGSLQLYVEGAVNEVNRSQEDMGLDDSEAIERQLDRVRVFDWLILNPDRPDDNLLYTPGDWRVHLIDQSQAFVLPTHGRTGARSRVPDIDDGLKARIVAVDEGALATAVESLLEPAEIEALLARFRKAQRR